jgi:hypothetical protein
MADAGARARAREVALLSSSARDLRLDFFRGAALIFIFIDHIPGNILSNFTLQSVQFCDAAEVFIFISGFTAALVYGRVLAAQGSVYAGALILRRAWQLYVAHVFLFMMFMAEVSYAATTFKNPMYADEMRVATFLQEPYIAIIKAMLLQFQPAFLDILPLYIVLMLGFPLILIGLVRRPLLILLPSIILYLVVQIVGLSVPAYPEGRSWYFNPLAWQFLFVAGAALGHRAGRGRRWPRLRSTLLPIAAVILGASFVIRVSWTLNGVWPHVPALLLKELWPADKHNLAPLRLASFFALVAVVAVAVRPQAAFFAGRVARPFLLCGRHSLEVFCLGILLSALAHTVLSEYDSGIAAQFAVNAAGIFVMALIAAMLDWYRSMGRAPAAAGVEPRSGGGIR